MDLKTPHKSIVDWEKNEAKFTPAITIEKYIYIKTETLKVKEEPTRDEDNRNVEVRTGDNREFEENIGEYEPHMEQVYRRREE